MLCSSQTLLRAHEDLRQLAADGVVTGPGGLSLGSANIIINCPALAFLDMPAPAIQGADDVEIPVGGLDTGLGGTSGATDLPAWVLLGGTGSLVLIGVGAGSLLRNRRQKSLSMGTTTTA